MKYLKNVYDLLLENVEPYDWKFISDDDIIVKYSFFDFRDNEYLVEFKNDYNVIKTRKGERKILTKQYELVYFVKDGDDYSVSKIVNAGAYRTIETILGHILPDFLKRKSWIDSIRMVGLSKTIEKDFITQRTKFYVRYLKNNPITGFELNQTGNNIYLKRK